jgi:hypothetical protein
VVYYCAWTCFGRVCFGIEGQTQDLVVTIYYYCVGVVLAPCSTPGISIKHQPLVQPFPVVWSEQWEIWEFACRKAGLLDFRFATSFVSLTGRESKGPILANALNAVILLHFLPVHFCQNNGPSPHL